MENDILSINYLKKKIDLTADKCESAKTKFCSNWRSNIDLDPDLELTNLEFNPNLHFEFERKFWNICHDYYSRTTVHLFDYDKYHSVVLIVKSTTLPLWSNFLMNVDSDVVLSYELSMIYDLQKLYW